MATSTNRNPVPTTSSEPLLAHSSPTSGRSRSCHLRKGTGTQGAEAGVFWDPVPPRRETPPKTQLRLSRKKMPLTCFH